MKRAVILAVALAALHLPAVECRASCPRSCILLSEANHCSTDSAFQYADFAPGAFDDSASWSIPSGQFSARTNSVWILTGWSILDSEDQFILQGVAPPEAVPLIARLRVHSKLDMYCCAGGQASNAIKINHAFDDSNVTTVKIYGPGWASLETDTTLDLPFVAQAGEAFRIAVHLRCISQSGAAAAQAQLEFIGIPVGTEIESCNGFRQGATPVVTTTWGRVKASYR